MTEKQSRQLDLILKTLIHSENMVYTIDKIKNDILPDESIDTCRVLFHILDNNYPQLLYPKIERTEDCFWSNDFAKAFITDGGFSKQFDSEFEQIQRSNEYEQLNTEKLKYDIKNAKRIFQTYWWTFILAILAFLISLYNFIKELA